MKKKAKKQTNSKFNFDDEYIIGVSNSASKTKKKVTKKKNVQPKKKKIAPEKKRTRMNENKKKVKKIITVISLSACIFIAAGCFLCLSPMFNLQEIYVENNSSIPSETIQSLSQMELYKNIFLINKTETKKHVEENPYIDSVKVSRVFPNKMKIEITEREEKYQIEFAEGKYAIIGKHRLYFRSYK